MIPRLTADHYEVDELRKNLMKFAVAGLRTLVMGQKNVDERSVDDFVNAYENIKVIGADIVGLLNLDIKSEG